MKKYSILIASFTALFWVNVQAQQISGAMGEKFKLRVIASKLSDPWEITYGPDKSLWITEAKGYRVSKIDPETGKRTILLDLNSERQFPRYDKMSKEASGGKPWPQGGLMGLALHPQLLTGKPFVYLAYLYRFEGVDRNGDGCKLNFGGCFFTTKIVRYEYNASTQKLLNPIILADTIPGSSDHNGGRLTIAPVNGKDYLFYAIGDLGAGQFVNANRPNHAQQKEVYEGKILRFNTEADADQRAFDQWIPADNPFNTTSRQNSVWSFGHRNPQGLIYAVVNGVGRLYSSEHGPFSDDEINVIEKGKNYGHPLIIGYPDGNYNGLAAGVSNHDSLPGKWHTSYPYIESEQENLKTIGIETYRAPMKTLYPNSNGLLTNLFGEIKSGNSDSKWPSEAPSSLAVYTSSAIPGWKNSVLLPTLKGGKLVRLKLNDSGDQITGDTINYFKGDVRYRDMAISSDGTKIYLSTDSGSVSSGPSKENPQQVSYKGSILEFTYLGQDTNSRPQSSKLPQSNVADEKKKIK
ncbi:MAG: PQQ-dependent sugar dehydrogenase [Janthinobacterium lividum]